jgi:hypothetical protein
MSKNGGSRLGGSGSSEYIVGRRSQAGPAEKATLDRPGAKRPSAEVDYGPRRVSGRQEMSICW